MSKKITAEETEIRAQSLNPKLSLVRATYVDTHTPCEWIEEGFGAFIRSPKKVVSGKQCHHPASTQARKETTSLKRYGTKNPHQAKIIQDKQQNTVRQRYGVVNVSELAWVKAKKQDTARARYNCEHTLQAPEVRAKGVQTCLVKYGATNYMKCPTMVRRISASLRAKHGVDWTPQLPEMKRKTQVTNLLRYKFKCALQNPDVAAKGHATKLRRGSYYKSEAERQILAYLQETIDPLARSTQTTYANRQFQIDIFVPSKSLCVEYNGMFWHSEGNKNTYTTKHLDKTRGCNDQGRRLIHIWETEWTRKQSQVKSYLNAVCGVFERRVAARKCTIVELLDRDLVQRFLNQNHLLGSCVYTTALGLVFNDELLGVALLGRHHRLNSTNVAKRFAFLSGVQVIGGISKLTKHLFSYTQSDHLVTWAEIRLGAEASYSAAGWVPQATLPPDYFYWNDNKKMVVSKQSRKTNHKGTGLTERQKALEDGLLRIYDCGKVRFVIRRPHVKPPCSTD